MLDSLLCIRHENAVFCVHGTDRNVPSCVYKLEGMGGFLTLLKNN